MSNATAGSEPSDLHRIARAVRFAVVAIVLAICVPTLHLSFSIGRFMTVFAELFRDVELPLITTIVFNARPAFWFLSVIIPIGALATLQMRDFVPSFYLLGVLTLFTVAQFLVLYFALSAPLLQLMAALNPRTG